MAEFPYVANPASLRKFLEHIQRAGVPQKVTLQYLESVGFKSKNDRSMIPVLRSLGFLDQSQVPTDLWRRYRNREAARVLLGTAMRDAYDGLFITYPDAYRKDNEALRNFFSSHSNVGDVALDFMVRTFKTLAELADFDSDASRTDESASKMSALQTSLSASQATPGAGNTSSVVINVNIQLELPATNDPEIYDKLFAALKKHMLQ